jgi:hypothetical protein
VPPQAACVLGLAPHSGWAAAVLLGGTAEHPKVLARSPQQLAVAVRALGAELGAPWGADQKSAALLAWLLLAECGAGL